DTLNGMIDARKNLEVQLRQQIEILTPNDYIRAKRCLGESEGTIKALQDPEVAKIASRRWANRTDSVGQLVQQMTRQGLKFAPAVSGDQSAYGAPHSAMVTFGIGMAQWTARAPCPPAPLGPRRSGLPTGRPPWPVRRQGVSFMV